MPQTLRNKIVALLEGWRKGGFPSTSEYIFLGRELLKWKRDGGAEGLWEKPPVMVTATLDDGWGNGLKPIHLYAELVGIDVIQLGLLKPAQEIVEACHKYRADMLGLTILQFDSIEDLEEIVKSIDSHVKVVVGGPIFKRTTNNDWAGRGYYAARDVSSFLHFLLERCDALAAPFSDSLPAAGASSKGCKSSSSIPV